jgi:hypothetical protein
LSKFTVGSVPGALFKFQVEGGPSLGLGDTWHGVSFSEPELRAMAMRCGFEARYLDGAGTQTSGLGSSNCSLPRTDMR